ncbi:MAG TPA: phage tail protein [Acidocella sp.]|nr:phage tail protein [Acidocella sp.]
MTTFIWNPDFNAQVTYAPNVLVAKFGDGYEQRVQFGINANLQKWNLTFKGRQDAEANAIDAFLQTAGGLNSFAWTPPGQTVALKFVCRKWTKTPVAGNGTAGAPAYIWDLTVPLEQVAEP